MKNELYLKPRTLAPIKPAKFRHLEISVLGDRNAGKSFVIREIKKFFKGIHVKEEIIGERPVPQRNGRLRGHEKAQTTRREPKRGEHTGRRADDVRIGKGQAHFGWA